MRSSIADKEGCRLLVVEEAAPEVHRHDVTAPLGQLGHKGPAAVTRVAARAHRGGAWQGEETFDDMDGVGVHRATLRSPLGSARRIPA